MAEPDVMRARPRLLPGVRLVQSEADGWVLLGLEGAYKVDASAAEIIERCTGEATLAAIIDDLASRSDDGARQDCFGRAVGGRQAPRPDAAGAGLERATPEALRLWFPRARN